eukprot:TRINITY_DN14795_c0_g1_i1.p1 TRINITY_DN14795_c0_g1~~TRINITY_DN14795_c0_g1_i1.p1  ORF type:complete len:164 (-),score=10.07 TRINITY_DN14795_c0_g1_i1:79-570(-)
MKYNVKSKAEEVVNFYAGRHYAAVPIRCAAAITDRCFACVPCGISSHGPWGGVSTVEATESVCCDASVRQIQSFKLVCRLLLQGCASFRLCKLLKAWACTAFRRLCEQQQAADAPIESDEFNLNLAMLDWLLVKAVLVWLPGATGFTIKGNGRQSGRKAHVET